MGALEESLSEGVEEVTVPVEDHHRVLTAVHDEYTVRIVY